MSKYRPFFVLLIILFLFTGLAGIRTSSQLQSNQYLNAGRNINMVSGTKLPGGDPWLQRQNEPSLAVSTRNPLHLLAGANDYRTVDIPQSEGELPGIKAAAAAGDAWLGILRSFDGGESWVTTLIPGFPQDNTPEGIASPLKQYKTATDPFVRSGTNGLFYYSGVAFNRLSPQLNALFIARFIDNNNSEKKDPIKYLGTKILDTGNAAQFIDMPSIAVDLPRSSKIVVIDGQNIPASNVYAVYAEFTGTSWAEHTEQLIFSSIP